MLANMTTVAVTDVKDERTQCRAQPQTSSQVSHEVWSEQHRWAVPATLVECFLADLRHLASRMYNSRHQVQVTRAQSPLLSHHSFTSWRPTLRRPVPVRVPPLCHRPDTVILLLIISYAPTQLQVLSIILSVTRYVINIWDISDLIVTLGGKLIIIPSVTING